MKTPDGYAFEINRTIQAAFGDSGYPLRLDEVVCQFAKVHAPGVSVEIVRRPLASIEGALVKSSGGKQFSILLNENIGSRGRQNFTLAHEFGHLLLHRSLRDEFHCGEKQVLGLTGDDLEKQANRFASQLMLPNNLVRAVADSADFSLDALKVLANRTGASLTATALAVIGMSSKPIGFVVVRDGFIKWGRASENGFRRGLCFRSGNAVPLGSAASFEGEDEDQIFDRGPPVEGWSVEDSWIEQGFYSARYKEAYFVLRL